MGIPLIGRLFKKKKKEEKKIEDRSEIFDYVSAVMETRFPEFMADYYRLLGHDVWVVPKKGSFVLIIFRRDIGEEQKKKAREILKDFI